MVSTITSLHKLITGNNPICFFLFFYYSLNSSLFSDDENMCSDSEESTCDADVRYEYSTVFISIYISSYIE